MKVSIPMIRRTIRIDDWIGVSWLTDTERCIVCSRLATMKIYNMSLWGGWFLSCEGHEAEGISIYLNNKLPRHLDSSWES